MKIYICKLRNDMVALCVYARKLQQTMDDDTESTNQEAGVELVNGISIPLGDLN